MYHIIINPASRSGKGLSIWKEQIEPELHKQNIVYRSYFSRKEGDIAKITREITSKINQNTVFFIILGGDGTINEALQGIQNLSQVILGYIPTGSSNDFARDLKIPTDPVEALNLILHSGTPQYMDTAVITCKDGWKKRFIVSCGIGFDAAICEESSRSHLKKFFNKIGLGKLTYFGIALKQLLLTKSVSCKITFDNNSFVEVKRMLFITVMLHRFEGGGFAFCPDADAHDGLLDLCVVGNLPKMILFLIGLPAVIVGKHFKIKGITPYKASKVSIETSSPLWLHTDGEVERRSSAFSVTCEPNSIQIVKK